MDFNSTAAKQLLGVLINSVIPHLRMVNILILQEY